MESIRMVLMNHLQRSNGDAETENKLVLLTQLGKERIRRVGRVALKHTLVK